MPGDHAGLSPALVETVAGLTAGSAATLAVHPLDIIKTRMQIHRSSLTRNGSNGIPAAAAAGAGAGAGAGPTAAGAAAASSAASPSTPPPRNLTTYSLIRTLLQTPHPLAALYRGLTPNLLGSATSWASFFFFKDRAEGLLLALKKRSGGGGGGVNGNSSRTHVYRGGGNDGESPAAEAGVRGEPVRGSAAAADQQAKTGVIPTSSKIAIAGQHQHQRQHPIAAGGDEETAPFPSGQKTRPTTLTPTDYFLASAFGGLCTQVLTNPIWVLKTRMVSSDASARGAYPSLTAGFAAIRRDEGFRGFYRGLGISLFGVTHGAVQFAVYDPLKRLWLDHDETKRRGSSSDGSKPQQQQQQQQNRLSTEATLVLSSVSKLVAGAVTYPYQVIRARLQNYDAEARFGKGIRGVALRLWREEGGIRGFYRGLVPGVVRVLPATWVTFLVYENMRFFLGEGKRQPR